MVNHASAPSGSYAQIAPFAKLRTMSDQSVSTALGVGVTQANTCHISRATDAREWKRECEPIRTATTGLRVRYASTLNANLTPAG